ncbi:hypothetical protein H6G35_05805 [Aulosira sp. FACHB-113]|nr:hypothetical protein [Aulosira sp. FACHB-113]
MSDLNAFDTTVNDTSTEEHFFSWFGWDNFNGYSKYPTEYYSINLY